ncbi:N-acetylneuraminate synthase family protein [Salinispira pacifica]|uniref:N-acetylneuraminate synthase n=1 Tax=Salinispira pacifica TaxID=1307761 RepID=V5WIH3_9SPIO|nr:N-acetylneuraminate synthase family protein [Salinispira pacifica]AHC15578.1 N-acetylneuraminate synthase [Salinispira pacifica]
MSASSVSQIRNSRVSPTEIVAEIGSGHRKDRNRARDLIAAASDAGADTVKFQHFYADEIVHPLTGMVELPGGSVPLHSRFRELELDAGFLEFLKNESEKNQLRFFCSPFGIRSAQDLIKLGESSFKIASPELNHIPLLDFLNTRAESLVLSTGVSRLGDMEEALSHVGDTEQLSLLHCITSYPAREEEYNLRLIPGLHALFGIPAGLSDHSIDPVLVPSLAVLLGAHMVEKHFTLSRSDGGLDDPIALPPEEFGRMTRAIREAESVIYSSPHIGSSSRHIADSPASPREHALPSSGTILEHAGRHSLLAPFSPDRIRSILGDGVKRLAPGERENYGKSNRSIHALIDLQPGDILSDTNMAVLRSEKNLRPGLHPRHFLQITGSRVQRSIRAGEGIVFTDLMIR